MLDSPKQVCRYVVVNSRRRAVRLEAIMWRGLGEIALNENTTIGALCDLVDLNRSNATLASALRVFVISYHRLHDDGKEYDPSGRSRHDPSLRTIAL
jgi:predicted DNA-binding ribbon-helix-helix protein